MTKFEKHLKGLKEMAGPEGMEEIRNLGDTMVKEFLALRERCNNIDYDNDFPSLANLDELTEMLTQALVRACSIETIYHSIEEKGSYAPMFYEVVEALGKTYVVKRSREICHKRAN